MSCQKCNSGRVVNMCSKSSECNHVEINGNEHNGYVPSDMGIGGSDYINISWCLDCGQIQGDWPVHITKIENNEIDNDC